MCIHGPSRPKPLFSGSRTSLVFLVPRGGEPFNITDNNGSTVLTVTDDESSAGSALEPGR